MIKPINKPHKDQILQAISNTHNKKAANLIFYSSDEDEGEEGTHERLCQTVRELSTKDPILTTKYSKQSCKVESTILRPSLMQSFPADQTDYYLPSSTNISNTTRRDNGLASTKASLEQKGQAVCEQSKKKQDLKQPQQIQEIKLANKPPPKPEISNRQRQRQIAQYVPSTLIFQDSESQDSNADTEAVNSPPPTSPPQAPLIDPTDLLNPEPESSYPNLLNLAPEVIIRSTYFSDILNNITDYERILELMFLPFPALTAQRFQVQVYSSFLQKSFQLWHIGPGRRCLMKASKAIRPNRTYYEIVTYLQHCYQYCQTCTLVSNLERTEFNIELTHNATDYLLGTIVCTLTLKNKRNLVLYYPQERVARTEDSPSLRQVYKEMPNHSVRYIATARLGEEEQAQLRGEYSLKESDKSMEFKGKDDHLRLVIGKKASKVYGLIAGPQLTPIQIFSLAIVNIETN